MAHEKLTDRPLLSKGQAALTDLVHIVDVSDNTPDAAGNSKKATIDTLRQAILSGGATDPAFSEVLATNANGDVVWTAISQVVTEDYVNAIVDGSGGEITIAQLTGPTGLIGDINGDGQTGASDLLLLLSSYGDSGPPAYPVRVDWDVNAGGYTTLTTSDTNVKVSTSYNATVMPAHAVTINTSTNIIQSTKPANAGNNRTQKLQGVVKIFNTVANVTVEVKGVVTKTNTASDTQTFELPLFQGILTTAKESGTPHTFPFDVTFLNSNTNFGATLANVTDIDIEVKANTSGEGVVSVRVDDFIAENT